MRTLFTTEDVKNLFNDIFNGNLEQYKANPTGVTYSNPNSENILLVDEANSTKTETDLAQYLNVHFYSWKDRLVDKSDISLEETANMEPFESWVMSINTSLDEAYGLVEVIDEEAVVSQDIDSVTKIGKITFIMQTNKIKNLDYYMAKLRNNYLGNPQDIQNSFGNIIKGYITIGTLMYDQEPTMTQLGECVLVSANFRFSYLNDALTYQDTKVSISFNGDDTYDSEGEIVGDTNFLEMPVTKITWQNIFGSKAVPTVSRPDLTGYVMNTCTGAKTLSFFDFNKELNTAFNTMFWKTLSYRTDGILTTVQDVNIPVYVKVVAGGHSYVYKDVVESMEKVLQNSDFTISSITLKTWGKS